MQSRYCMNPDKSAEITAYLNKYLANLNVLAVKLRNYHWNIIGMSFFTLHETFGYMYEIISQEIECVAEDIIQLGFRPIATLYEAMEFTTMKEAENLNINSIEASDRLINDFQFLSAQARFIAYLAVSNYDYHTQNLMTKQISFYQKYIWYFSAFLSMPVDNCFIEIEDQPPADSNIPMN